jgi:hypothetical protein
MAEFSMQHGLVGPPFDCTLWVGTHLSDRELCSTDSAYKESSFLYNLSLGFHLSLVAVLAQLYDWAVYLLCHFHKGLNGATTGLSSHQSAAVSSMYQPETAE